MNRTQLVLLIAILSLGSFYTWSKINKLETTEREYQEARYFPSLEEEQVESIRVKSKEPAFEYELRRFGDQWYIGPNMLNVEKTHQLVRSVLDLSREREMEAQPDDAREKEFQLDEPSYLLTVVKNGGETLGTVKLGKRTPDFNHFYGQMESGGPISTVPAYTLSVLEEPPKDLREASLFPVEVASVERLSVGDGKTESIILNRLEEKNYEFQKPELGLADESQVAEFLTQLKDSKVGRFLAPDEEAESGSVVLEYRGKVTYSDYDVVSQIQQRVAATPKLVYGKRYLCKAGETEPVANTLERFVIELHAKGEILNPTPKMFEDRRALVFDIDKVVALEVNQNDTKQASAKDKMGKWVSEADQSEIPEANDLLWALKDLRFEAKAEDLGQPDGSQLALKLEYKSAKPTELRFAEAESGKPYLWRGSEAYFVSDDAWAAFQEAVHKYTGSP